MVYLITGMVLAVIIGLWLYAIARVGSKDYLVDVDEY